MRSIYYNEAENWVCENAKYIYTSRKKKYDENQILKIANEKFYFIYAVTFDLPNEFNELDDMKPILISTDGFEFKAWFNSKQKEIDDRKSKIRSIQNEQ